MGLCVVKGKIMCEKAKPKGKRENKIYVVRFVAGRCLQYAIKICKKHTAQTFTVIINTVMPSFVM